MPGQMKYSECAVVSFNANLLLKTEKYLMLFINVNIVPQIYRKFVLFLLLLFKNWHASFQIIPPKFILWNFHDILWSFDMGLGSHFDI